MFWGFMVFFVLIFRVAVAFDRSNGVTGALTCAASNRACYFFACRVRRVATKIVLSPQFVKVGVPDGSRRAEGFSPFWYLIVVLLSLPASSTRSSSCVARGRFIRALRDIPGPHHSCFAVLSLLAFFSSPHLDSF